MNEVTTKCERCGTPIVIVRWDEGAQWMERLGWASVPRAQVWVTHTQENCTQARDRALGRL